MGSSCTSATEGLYKTAHTTVTKIKSKKHICFVFHYTIRVQVGRNRYDSGGIGLHVFKNRVAPHDWYEKIHGEFCLAFGGQNVSPENSLRINIYVINSYEYKYVTNIDDFEYYHIEAI